MNDVSHKHPSYAVASFSKRSGNPDLFGSPLTEHFGYVTLSIARAELVRRVHDDLYRAPMDGDVVEVDFSVAQFAELLTTMNTAPGTPCTIRRLNRERVPPPPRMQGRVENLQARYEEELKNLAECVIGTSVAEVQEILGHKTITKQDRSEIMSRFREVARKLSDYVPYAVVTLNEAVTERVAVAKAELVALRQAILTGLNKTEVKALPESYTADNNDLHDSHGVLVTPESRGQQEP